MKVKEWIKYNAKPWYEFNISSRLFKLCIWWRQEITRYYLKKAMPEILNSGEVLPDTVKVNSWRRLWIPVTIEITMMPSFSLLLCNFNHRLQNNKSWIIVSRLGYCWVYLIRNYNYYVIDRKVDAKKRMKYAILLDDDPEVLDAEVYIDE